MSADTESVSEDALQVLLAQPKTSLRDEQVLTALARALEAAGAISPPIRIEHVEAVVRTALGKAPLIKARRRAPDGRAAV